MRNSALIYLNGKRHEVGPEHAGMMLSDFLRYKLNLTGTKIVCAEGDCGACTVLRLYSGAYLPINACITTVAQMDCSSLITVDALADPELTPVQSALMNCHGSQCGFCTPGFVMALTGLVEKKISSPEKKRTSSIKLQEAKNALTGNLCRCTGYQPILNAAQDLNLSKCSSVKDRFYSKTQEKQLRLARSQPLHVESDSYSFFAPTTLKEAVRYLRSKKITRLLAAGTDLGVVHNKRKLRLDHVLSLHLIPELYEIKKLKAGRLSVGARVTLSELRTYLKDEAPEFSRFLDLFASPQIKNLATLVGNIANASPIADTPPFLLAMNAQVQLVGPKEKRSIALETFYVSYRKTKLAVGEIISAITLDMPSRHDDLGLYKVSQRKDLDISAVNLAIRVEWKDKDKSVAKDTRIAVGGVAATPIRLYKTEKSLRGQALSTEILAKATAILHSEIKPLSDLRGSKAFRHVALENLFLKFFRGLTRSERIPR